MAREFDGPLSADDLVYLRARYSREYIEHLIRVHGVEDGAEDAEGPSADDTQAALEEAAQKAEEDRLRAEAEAAEAAAAAEAERQRQEAEDLIGGTGDFDVLGATESEVKTWATTATDEEKAAALATEQGREDRDPRKGVVSILGG